MNTQSVYTSFVGKVLVLIVFTLFAWGNVWAETILNTRYNSTTTISGDAKTFESLNWFGGTDYDDLTISGSSTIVVITGDLKLNGKLTLKEGATLIVHGNVESTKHGLSSSWIQLQDGSTMIIEGNLTLDDQLHVDAKSFLLVKRLLIANNNLLYVESNSNLAVLGYTSATSQIKTGAASDKEIIHKNGLTNYANVSDVYIEGSKNYNSPSVLKKAKDFLQNNASLLPISLTSFIASQNGEEIEIAWTTNSEVNNDYFTVEYSIDGVSFKTLETVAGSGTTSEVNDYAITTEASRFSGVVYFRLKQTDYNGEYSYSDVVTLAVESSNELYVYPNPAVEFVSVSGTYKTAIVQDMFGKKVACATNGEQIFVGNLSVGTYYIVVATENGKKVLPFVKE